MIKVNVLCEEKSWSKKIKKKEELFNKICKYFPRKFRFVNKKVYLTLLLSNNKKIKFLNKKFRKKNKATDILSFPFFDKKNLKKKMKSKKFYLGDIIISHEEFLKKNKNNYTNSFKKIFIHGFLHLLSFDHKSEKDYKTMNSLENLIFKKVKG